MENEYIDEKESINRPTKLVDEIIQKLSERHSKKESLLFKLSKIG